MESESPRQFHFHEFRGPVERFCNSGQRGGKRPGAGRPRLYRDGEKPRYKYRYRYINVAEEVFTKFQRLKFEAGCKAEKNFMILLLDLYEKNNRSFESSVDIGSTANLERWTSLCAQFNLSSEQFASYMIDVIEHHLIHGRCPGNIIFPTVSTQQQMENQNSSSINNDRVVVKSEPSDPSINDTGEEQIISSDPQLSFGNLGDTMIQNSNDLSNQHATPSVLSAQPVENPRNLAATPPRRHSNEDSRPASNDNAPRYVIGDAATDISSEIETSNKTPQPYVTFKWWNVFPSERAKRKSRCNQISNLLASGKPYGTKLNIIKETNGYIPKSISQILPKSSAAVFSPSTSAAKRNNTVKTADTTVTCTVNPPDYASSVVLASPVVSALQNAPMAGAGMAGCLPMVWSVLPPVASADPVNSVSSCVASSPIVENELPLNLSLKADASGNRSKSEGLPKATNGQHNDTGVISTAQKMADGDKELSPHSKPKIKALSDPKVQRKVQNLISTIKKIGGQNICSQNKSTDLTKIISGSGNDANTSEVESPQLDNAVGTKSSRKMAIPTKKTSESPEIKKEVKEHLIEAINHEISKAGNTSSVVENSQKRKSAVTSGLGADPVVNHDPDGRYYIMSLCKKKKNNDPEFGRWSFAKTRSWQRNGKRQWKINRIENYICKSCGKTFMSEKWFIKHVEAEHCGKSKDSKYLSEGHDEKLADYHSTQVGYMCNVCSKSFVRETELFLHKSSGPCHKKDDYMTEGFHRCKVSDCCRIFSSEYNLFQHTKRCHDTRDIISNAS